MSTDLRHPDDLTDVDTEADTDDRAGPHLDDLEPDTVEVRRDGPLAWGIGAVAALMAVAYLHRALGGSPSALDWLLGAVLVLIAGAHLLTAIDARAPLMVVDPHGVRVRRGRTWRGIAWPEVARVEHTLRSTTLRDGRLTVVDVDDNELTVRLALSTRLIGANWHELTGALLDLSDGRAKVYEVVDVEPDHALDHPDHLEDSGLTDDLDEVDLDDNIAAEPAPEPVREPVLARRSEVVHGTVVHDDDEAVTLVGVAAVADVDHDELHTVLIDGLDAGPAVEILDPVVGPVLRGARTRLGLSVDQLADRTRIRPHVIEAVEVDDFGPCGGDFYARGHLRTLARVLGVEAAPLLESYDERYSALPVDPRSVFEAELATTRRASHGGRGRLNWSVLVAAVMAVVLVWSIARLVTDGPVQLTDKTVLNGSPGGKAALSGNQTKTPKVPVTFTAATGGAEVIVRDAKNEVVFEERLAFMQTAKVDVVPPVRISSSDGGLLVTVDGDDRGALGKTGQDAQNVFVVRK